MGRGLETKALIFFWTLLLLILLYSAILKQLQDQRQLPFTIIKKLLTLMKSTIIKREGILMKSMVLKKTKDNNTLVFIVNTLVLPPALSQNPSSHFSYTKPVIQHHLQHPYHCPYSMPPLPDNQRRFVADEQHGVWMNGGRPPHSGPPFGHEGIYSSHSCG